MSSTRGSIKGFFENLSERRDRRAYTRSNSPLVTYIDLGDGNGGIALNISEGGLVVVTPSGFRIEGLDANGAATLIRQLA